jgi:ABC-type transport system involved in cytochrome c biogenesis permease component
MTFLPIVERELRITARHPGTYWARLGAAFVSILFGGWVLITYNLLGFGGRGAQSSFSALTFYAFIYCLIAGVKLTSDCLSVEKREGTLGFLFLTDLKGYDIVLGKLLAASLTSFYALLAVFPVLSIVLILGGVRAVDFLRMMLALVNTLFFSLAIGMAISAFNRHRKKSESLATVLILFFWLGLPALGSAVQSRHPASLINPVLQMLSPSYAQSIAMSSGLGLRPDYFWWSLLVVHLEGWLFLALASWWLPHAWQERVVGVQRLRWRERWQQWGYGNAATRKEYRTRLLNRNPFFWLAARDRLKPLWVWGLMAIIVFIAGWFYLAFAQTSAVDGLFIAAGSVAIAWYLLLKLYVAGEAGRQLAEERANGSLELLVSTSLSVKEIVNGQWLALWRQFAGPVCATLAMGTVILFGAISFKIWNWSGSEGGTNFIMLTLAMMIMLVADVIALGWVGMWTGLSRPARQASGAATARIIVLPTLAFGILLTLQAYWARNKGTFYFGFASNLIFWFVLGLANDLLFSFWARQQLRRRFRLMAAQRFVLTEAHPLWRRAGLWYGRLFSNKQVMPLPPVIAP